MKPQIQLEPSGHSDVDKVLAAGFNLPELVAAAVQAGNGTRQIEAAVEAERMRLAAIVRGLGYLDARVVLELPARHRGSESTLRVHGHDGLTQIGLRPDVGPLYRIGAIEVLGLDDDSLADLRENVSDLLAQYPGQIARGDILSKVEHEIVWRARNASYGFAEVIAREVIRDDLTATALVRIAIETGPPVTFGRVNFGGVVRTDVSELSSRLTFSAGDAYSVEALENFRDALESPLMFRSVRVALGEIPDAAGRLPVDVQVREAPPDPKPLRRNGMLGLSITAVALGLIALRQLILAVGAPRNRLLRGIDGIAFVLIVAAAQLGWQRVTELAGAG